MTSTKYLVLLVIAGLLFAGCSRGVSSSNGDAASQDVRPAAASAHLLASEPQGATSVKDARQAAKDKDQVAVVGRVGGEVNPWVEGAAAFTIVDLSLKPCEDGCETPWDYCCDLDTLPGLKAMVKVVDPQGRMVNTDARKLLGLKELQTVVVHGTAKRDDGGNLTILADGLFVRP